MERIPKRALVTGANRGMGLETCRQLARLGYQVILTSREETSGKQAVQSLAQQGLTVLYQHLDVADPQSVQQAQQATGARTPPRAEQRWVALEHRDPLNRVRIRLCG